MSLQEQRNKAKEQNKHNKKFIEEFNEYLGKEWNIIYKNTTEKFGSNRIRKMTLRVEYGTFGKFSFIFRIPNIDEVQTFNYHTFGTTLRAFHNCEDPLRKLFLDKFYEYREVIILKEKLEEELPKTKQKERKVKI